MKAGSFIIVRRRCCMSELRGLLLALDGLATLMAAPV
jgi:hypothetical protein